MKVSILFFILFTFPLICFSQFPPLEIGMGTLTVGTTGTVDVPVTAGTNWQNITSVSGTFTYNPAVLSWNSMQNWGLSNPAGVSFTNPTPGVIAFTWMSLISVGPTIPSGGLLFNLRFNIIGAQGTSSAINFTNTPQASAWGNGFGWSGNNFTPTPGLISIGCLGTNPTFNAIANFYTYSFTDGSTGATSWSWNLGDGTTATTQNVNHTYAAPGTYAVCLTSTNTCGSSTFCQNVAVCTSIPVVGYTFIQNGLTVIFTDTTQGAPTSRLWDFGDGTTGNATNSFIHNFPSSGTYNVCLIASNGCGADTICKTITVSCTLPTASFTNTANNTTYSFTNTSTSALTWAWNFGNGATSTLQNPTHTFASNGTYNVCLIATNTCGSDTLCQNITVSCPTPGSAWTVSTSFFTSTFTDATPSTPTAWLWKFGDGATSTLQDPVHTYFTVDTFNVCLITTNACGADTSCQTVITSTVGLTDLNTQFFQIFPNPAKEFVQINSAMNGEMNVHFYDLQGKLLHKATIVNGQKIDTHEWAKGAYLVVLSNENSTYHQRLIIE